jgi:hypothetical protein
MRRPAGIGRGGALPVAARPPAARAATQAIGTAIHATTRRGGMRTRVLTATLMTAAVLCPGAQAATADTPAPAAATASPTATPAAPVPAAAAPEPAAAAPEPAAAAPEPTAAAPDPATAEVAATPSPEPAAAEVAATPTPEPTAAPSADPATHHRTVARSRGSTTSPASPTWRDLIASKDGVTGSLAQAQTPPPPGCQVTPEGVSCPDERVCVVTSGGLQCFGGAQCTITSAGVTCPTEVPVCVVVSGSLTCSQGCAISSAGPICPPAGGVLGETPAVNPPPRRPQRRTARRTPAPPRAVEHQTAGFAPGELPFTGAPVMPSILAGWLLLAAGLLLRRRTRSPAPGTDAAASPSRADAA